MTERLRLRSEESGLVLISIVLIIGALTVIGLSLTTFASTQYRAASDGTLNTNSLLTAEAGVEQSLQQLNANDNFGGYPAEQEFFNNASQGRGTYTVSITNSPGDNNAKIITSTGKVYRYKSQVPVSTKIVKVTAVGTASQGYSVAAGVGGLIMKGGSSITNTDVYVNGTINLIGAAKIGTYSQPVNVFVANQACPSGSSPGPTYPQVCTTTQPIGLDWGTNIYGTVCATGQTYKGPYGNNIQGGSSGEGLKVGCTAPPAAMPTYDRAAQISQVTKIGSGTDNTYVCNAWPFDRTWQGNLELTGNVFIGSSCHLTIKGNVYITGDLSIDNAARITIDDSVGNTRPVIVVDGKINVGGAPQFITNSSGTGAEFISFKSNASCGSACTSLSGNALKSSSTLETVHVTGAASLAGMIFYAYWGQATIDGGSNVGSILGQTLYLDGAGAITFGTTLSSGARTWTISSYQQQYPGKP